MAIMTVQNLIDLGWKFFSASSYSLTGWEGFSWSSWWSELAHSEPDEASFAGRGDAGTGIVSTGRLQPGCSEDCAYRDV
jgi:hypothetical protein